MQTNLVNKSLATSTILIKISKVAESSQLQIHIQKYECWRRSNSVNKSLDTTTGLIKISQVAESSQLRLAKMSLSHDCSSGTKLEWNILTKGMRVICGGAICEAYNSEAQIWIRADLPLVATITATMQ